MKQLHFGRDNLAVNVFSTEVRFINWRWDQSTSWLTPYDLSLKAKSKYGNNWSELELPCFYIPVIVSTYSYKHTNKCTYTADHLDFKFHKSKEEKKNDTLYPDYIT